MEQKIPVTLDGEVIYRIELTNQFQDLPARLAELGYQEEQKICIVTDSNVANLYIGQVQEILQKNYPNLIIHIFEAGEANKNVMTVNKLYEILIRNHFDRRDLLIALGGGVVGDLTGFAAATYLRGIDFIQVPTTLLSQVDSSIGGKTGVDFLQYKNMVGAFYQPRLVYMNLKVLDTLPEKQLISGLGEILKHGLIKDSSYFAWMETHCEEILALNEPILQEMIFRSCNIKRDVVERDPREKGERALLNFGHTIGHAIEKLSDFQLYHGECVGLGIAAASYLSFKNGFIDKDTHNKVEDVLQRFGLSTFIEGYHAKEVLQATKSDKKMVGSKVKFILLHAIGDAFIYQDLTEEEILEGIRHVCR